jgi:flavin reductase (DIM6/NTAB) family NADH-FMN oxidoreductase RutF
MTEFISPPSFHTLLHPCHTALVTCCNELGQQNIISIAWITPVSHRPPMLGLSIRPDRYSYGLILSNGEFVVNMAPLEMEKIALFCGRTSGIQVDKFKETGLTPAPARRVRPPRIAECSSFIECKVNQIVEAGDHHFLIADVLEAYAYAGCIDAEGLYNLDQFQPLLHLGKDTFAAVRRT